MGIADVLFAFNAVSEPQFSCTRAFMDTIRDDGEWTVLTFFGNGADGNTFEVTSPRLSPGADLQLAARQTAQNLIDQGTPAP